LKKREIISQNDINVAFFLTMSTWPSLWSHSLLNPLFNKIILHKSNAQYTNKTNNVIITQHTSVSRDGYFQTVDVAFNTIRTVHNWLGLRHPLTYSSWDIHFPSRSAQKKSWFVLEVSIRISRKIIWQQLFFKFYYSVPSCFLPHFTFSWQLSGAYWHLTW
jgi:hypothetical protein